MKNCVPYHQVRSGYAPGCGTCASIVQLCIGMKKIQLAIKNGANVIGHVQPIRFLCLGANFLYGYKLPMANF